MRTIIRIARLELSALFYSPVAWLALIIFVIQSGIDFTSALETWEKYQEMGEKLDMLTSQVYTSHFFGLFTLMQGNLYLYTPLLTMGLISRELHSGSIKLLLSSPVTIPEIVFGKYLAMMAYGLVLLIALVGCAAAGTFIIRSIDIKLLISGLLGLYLLICAYSAIGLFMSSLTSYQVVAAISTFVIFAALNYIGNIGQTIDFVKDITWFLSISGRCSQLISGLISTKDVMYFIIVITLFLGLAILKLRAGRESISPMRKGIRYFAFISATLLLGYLTSRPALTGYLDMTATRSRTLTPNSQLVIRNMHAPLKIHTYVNMLDANFYNGLPGGRNRDLDFFEQYQRFLPGLTIDYYYYYDSSKNERMFKNNPGVSLQQLAQRTAHATMIDPRILLSPAQIRQRVDLAPEENRFVRQLEYGTRTTFLRMFSDADREPGEEEITAALKRLVVTPPKIAFLAGNDERSIDRAGDKDYKFVTRELTFRYSLINQGYDVITLPPADTSIPKDLTALVVADPKTAFSPGTLNKVNQYLASGGNMLIAGEPGGQDLIDPLLRSLGVEMKAGRITQISKDFAPDFVKAAFSPEAGSFVPVYQTLRQDRSTVAMPGAAALTYEKNGIYTVHPLLIADSAMLALALTRNIGTRQQKIVVMGDADFMSTAELSRRNTKTANFQFIRELFKWYADAEFPIDTKRPPAKDSLLFIGRDGIGMLKIVLLGLIPAILLIGASILLVRRIRK